MLHILHMIERRRAGRPLPGALPLAVVLGLLLLAGIGLSLAR